MRPFFDRAGNRWDVVVGRASWGAFYALFAPRGHDQPVRQTLIEAQDAIDAQRHLDDISDDRLQDMLDRSEPKEE